MTRYGAPESGQADDLVQFAPEDTARALDEGDCWRVLAVDDDEGFQRSTELALRNLRLLGRPLVLVQAYCLAEAARLLARDRDFAVVLADVVMETDDAGLRLVKGIREMLGLSEVRIILLTGQPGFAPIDEVMQNYDLSDYCLKSELAHRGLRNVLTAALRGYRDLRALSAARKGLQLILEASNRLSTARTIRDMSQGVLSEIASLLGLRDEGIVCVRCGASPLENFTCNAETGAKPLIVGATGRYVAHLDGLLEALPNESVRSLIGQALSGRLSIECSDSQVIYFPPHEALAEYVVYLATDRRLDDSELELLRVFAANASKGFGNVGLISRLDRLAYEDELLRIPNRSAALREIERLRLGERSRPYKLVLLDVDNFAGLNDAFGVKLGNRVLKALLDPLRQAFPPPAFIARITADLFLILGDAAAVDMHKAASVLTGPLRIDAASYRLSACCTEIALDAIDGDASELLRAARGGLRAAKACGPGSAVAYDEAFERLAAERFELVSDLAEALDGSHLELMFQPQIDLKSGRLVGVEGLLRWPRESGFVSPARFIPIAEQSALIHSIGEMVVRQACEASRELERSGFGEVLISVNVSARQFVVPTLIESIHEQCAQSGLTPGRLGLEVTETTAMQSFEEVAAALRTHRERGGFVAIDDFGTGMSSLQYLLDLPADHLKIDRTFVAGVETDELSRQIVRLIIDLARRIDVEVIAEGVETQAQADWLRRQGCHMAQGWLFAKAMKLPELIEFCRRNAQEATRG